MRKQTKIGLVLVLAIVLTLNNTPVNAESSLSQDFEGALTGWSGASGGSHGGVIVQGNRVLIAPRFGTVALWGLTSPGKVSIFTCYSQNSWESIGISTIR